MCWQKFFKRPSQPDPLTDYAAAMDVLCANAPAITVARTLGWGEIYALFLQPLPSGRGVEVRDARYAVLSRQDWEALAAWNPVAKVPYVDDFHDCENYRDETLVLFQWLAARKYSTAFALGSTILVLPDGRPHATNMLVYSEDGNLGLGWYDTTPGWKWTSNIVPYVRDGEGLNAASITFVEF